MAHDRRCTVVEAHSDGDCNVARLVVEIKPAEGWERTSSCNGCRLSKGVNRSDPEVTRVMNIASVGMGLGSGSEFRLCDKCWEVLLRAVHMEELLSSERD